jgi:hypothetical protein
LDNYINININMKDKTKIICNECGKKIPKLFIQMYTCRCEKRYCNEHLPDHVCTFQYKKMLILQPKINAIKVDSI